MLAGQVTVDGRDTTCFVRRTVTETRGTDRPRYRWPSSDDAEDNVTVRPSQVAGRTRRRDIGYDPDHSDVGGELRGSVARAMDGVELTTVELLATYEGCARLRPVIGRVVLRTSRAASPCAGREAELDDVRRAWNRPHRLRGPAAAGRPAALSDAVAVRARSDWRDTIRFNAMGIGMAEEGEAMIADLETDIADAVAERPELDGKSAMFLTHVDTTDLSEVSYHTTHDTRALFFEDLGLVAPASVADASEGSEEFAQTTSAERVDTFDDVDVIVTYGGQELVDTLQGDPLLSKMPAVENDAVVFLGSDPLGTAANPTPLSISYVLEDYLHMLAEAAGKAS